MRDRSFESSRGEPQTPREKREAELRAGLKRLAEEDRDFGWHLGARLRNYFLTGLIIVGPVTLTVYIIWWLVNVADAWFKPFVPRQYLPDTYLPFAVPGVGLVFGIVSLTIIGALTANLLGRTLISYGELMLGRMPIVRNVYRALKQIFESVVTATDPNQSVQKVGLIEFPSKGLWSIVFVTGEVSGEIARVEPGGNRDLYTVFMPTGIVPPTGFICFVPKADVIFLNMSIEDAAKIVISGGMVAPSDAPSGKVSGERGFRPGAKQVAGAVGVAAPPEVAKAMQNASRAKPRPRR
ncbi:MAG TPA: DUF502 domain-containing protein [Hyphomicrobiaceae bacterium]|nr:DUF502 domain-containing protein [Hyphomicrobiaceae bacterium]